MLVAGAVVAMVVPLSAPSGVAAAAPNQTQSWYQHVVADLRPLQSSLLGGLEAASSWANGSETAAAARAELNREIPRLEQVQGRLQALRPLAGHRRAHDDYVSGIGLYVEAMRVELAATELPVGPLTGQLQHSFERIRELGDVTFDQGTAELAPQLGSAIAGADVAAATHVPDWPAVGLVPGTPLATSWHASAATPSGTQSETSWSADVENDGAPSQSSVREAIVAHRSSALLTPMVAALSAAEAQLSGFARPASDPQASNRARLGLLVDAEGLLTAEAGGLGGGQPARVLASVAPTLGSIGGVLRAEG